MKTEWSGSDPGSFRRDTETLTILPLSPEKPSLCGALCSFTTSLSCTEYLVLCVHVPRDAPRAKHLRYALVVR